LRAWVGRTQQHRQLHYSLSEVKRNLKQKSREERRKGGGERWASGPYRRWGLRILMGEFSVAEQPENF
jgi:hypothetical protein